MGSSGLPFQPCLPKVPCRAMAVSTGLLSSFDSFGRIAGPPIGGWLFSISIDLPFISGAILSVFALILFQLYHARTQTKQVQASH